MSNVKEIIDSMLDESKIVMVLTKAELRTLLGYSIVAHLLKDEGTKGLYVALNIPHTTVEKKVKKMGADPSKLFFVDCITASIKTPEERENVIYLNEPSSILLEGAIRHGLKVLDGERNFVYIESISTFLAYNTYQSFIRFLRMITNEIRLYGLVGIIFMLDKELEDVEFNQATTFVDDIIDLRDITREDLEI
jgi:KaiC/GvpD/RAD55 family RecA-like ATPase